MIDRWKYVVASLKSSFTGTVSDQQLQEMLDRHGSQGWELVEILRSQGSWGNVQLVFKKPA